MLHRSVRRRQHLGTLLDLAACSLPSLLLLAAIDYTAWCAWWI